MNKYLVKVQNGKSFLTMTMTRTRIAHTSALIFYRHNLPLNSHYTIHGAPCTIQQLFIRSLQRQQRRGGGEWMEGQRASIHLTRRHMFIQLNLMIRTLDSILGKGLGRFWQLCICLLFNLNIKVDCQAWRKHYWDTLEPCSQFYKRS